MSTLSEERETEMKMPMKKTILAVLAVLPLAAAAQTQGGARGGAGQGQAAGPSPEKRAEMVEKRASLARILGLAEALDLDTAQALKLRDTLARFDERRVAAHRQLAEAHRTLREAAMGGKATAAQVDEAIKKAQDARAQVDSIRREAFNTIAKDLKPEQRARAFLFLGRFESRFGPRPMRGPGMHGPGGGMGPGMGGPGMGGRGQGMGRGMGGGMGMGAGGGMGMGPGAGMGPGPAMGMGGFGDEDCPNGDCPMMDDDLGE
jgi:Spy/CpxP family protein refolding chaperone